MTDPNGGKVLGTSGSSTPVEVSGGKFKQCYKLWDVVAMGGKPGFADTPNKGGVYKVWVSPDAGFAAAKTDNFKVSPAQETPPKKVGPAQVDRPSKGGPKSHAATKWKTRQQLTGWPDRLVRAPPAAGRVDSHRVQLYHDVREMDVK